MVTPKRTAKIQLTLADRKRLKTLANSQTEEYRKVQRAKIILLCADGKSNAEIAAIMKKRVPDQLSIGITARCPNRCIHCGAADIKPERELTLDEISGAVDQSLDLGTYLISFDGCETMFRNDLVEMVARVD